MVEARQGRPLLVWSLLALPALLLWGHAVDSRLPAGGVAALEAAGGMEAALLRYSLLPRLCVALLAGASLGLAGALLQRVLRNPIADPSTLGISAGAQLAVAVFTLFPAAALALGLTREGAAFAGGLLAAGLVLLLGRRRGLEPTTLVLAGMLVSLTAGGVSAALILFNGDYLMSLFIWGGGSLSQQGWQPTLALAGRLAAAALAVLLVLRPLAILGLEDASARSLGVAVVALRLLAVALAVWLAAGVVAEVGVIGFLGLAAPAFARLAGARGQRQLLLWAPLIGAALLCLADGLVQLLAGGRGEILPTGAVTALLGGPLLIWLLPRLRTVGPALTGPAGPATRPTARPERLVLGLLLLLGAALTLALLVGRDPEGWHLATGQSLRDLLPWRLPRLAAAVAAGAMLAVAGTIVQRLTGNPLASPEILGIGAGSGLGLAAVLFSVSGAGLAAQLGGAALGAFLALLTILLLATRAGGGAERLLLGGIAVGSFCGALLTILMASGDSRAFQLLAWLTGSTHQIGAEQARLALASAVLLLASLPFLVRWLGVLPLGEGVAAALGAPVAAARLLLVGLAALLTAAACLLVGPLSFVGLMAPHLARLAGLTRPGAQLLGAAVIGALLLAAADFLSRQLFFPYEMPVGLFASLVGAPYLVWFLGRAPAGGRRG